MSIRQIREIKESSSIEEWGNGYFSINNQGQVVCTPLGPEAGEIALPDVLSEARQQNIRTPLIIRFPQIIASQLRRLHTAFSRARDEFSYSGKHLGVFPFKVNQRREFIDTIVSCGKSMDWGLEVGSKTELMAALSYQMSKDSLLICNGFKDPEFIEQAFLARALAKKTILVVEGPNELNYMIHYKKEHSVEANLCPELGIRVRLYSKGSGKWQSSSGERSKFGLTTVELLEALNILEKAKLEDKLSMLHFHIGSQITAIKHFKNAIREAAYVYAKIVKLGFSPKYLNIGGGIGVDYDGSQTTAQSSANYSLQEIANDAVYLINEVCKKEEVPCPHIITESGRVVAAYHSVVATDIREVQGEESLESLEGVDLTHPPEGSHKSICEMHYILRHMSHKNYSEFYHDAVEHQEDLFTLFNLGYINLKERALAEEFYHKICQRALYFASQEKYLADDFDKLLQEKASKYLANFSIFQSIPDAWAINQLFPVLPLSDHNKKTTRQATIVDITCDSDGCVDRFIDRKFQKKTIDLHGPSGKPYYIGFFLVGAYQESLSNEHNLFGAINELEVILNSDGEWEILKTTPGDSIKELLTCRNYDIDGMLASYKEQIKKSVEKKILKVSQSENTFKKLKDYLGAYPYLEAKEETE